MVHRNALVAAIVVVTLLAFILGHACRCQETTSRIEAELQVYRMAYSVLMPLLNQPRVTGVPDRLPVSFILEEPECAQRLLDHLKLKNVRVIHPGTASYSTAWLNGSARNAGQVPAQSSP